jgi:hypothetical protein
MDKCIGSIYYFYFVTLPERAITQLPLTPSLSRMGIKFPRDLGGIKGGVKACQVRRENNVTK